MGLAISEELGIMLDFLSHPSRTGQVARMNISLPYLTTDPFCSLMENKIELSN